MTDETLTPARLWKRMTPDQRLHAARAFWLEEQAGDDHVQAMMLIAQRKKFRPKTVVSLDVERKASHLASLAGMPDALAGRDGFEIRDEIRMVRPGFYLGRAYIKRVFVLNFTLYDKEAAEKDAGAFQTTGTVQQDCWVGPQRTAMMK